MLAQGESNQPNAHAHCSLHSLTRHNNSALTKVHHALVQAAYLASGVAGLGSPTFTAARQGFKPYIIQASMNVMCAGMCVWMLVCPDTQP